MPHSPDPAETTGQASPDERWGRLRNTSLLVLVILTWAVSWPIIKVGVSEVPPIWFGVLRYLIATILTFGVLAVMGGLQMPSRSDWPLVLVSGTLQMGVYSALMAIALVTLPPGRASVLAYSTPLWVVPLAAWWLGERASKLALGGVAMGASGVLAIAAPSMSLSEPQQALAYLALVAASVAWAITIVFIRAHRFVASAFALAPWQMLVAGAMLLPCALLLEGPPPTLGRTGIVTLAFIAPISTAFGYWAVVEAGRYFRANTMAMGLLATPSLGILISALTLGEKIDGSLIAGVALVAGGIWLTMLAAGRAAKSAP